uniref:Uncharacterized protein n=1 Tax=Ditylum brightwellii TaxID=49249 RepID=A0A6U3TC93_9STRA|mmetsp:Transcript_27433/g.40781  ORF Transcript_27433/g.40781 Transcript_27433/m.40781 type:complete len:480 (+) Transcript_27433:381-1820(+)
MHSFVDCIPPRAAQEESIHSSSSREPSRLQPIKQPFRAIDIQPSDSRDIQLRDSNVCSMADRRMTKSKFPDQRSKQTKRSNTSRGTHITNKDKTAKGVDGGGSDDDVVVVDVVYHHVHPYDSKERKTHNRHHNYRQRHNVKRAERRDNDSKNGCAQATRSEQVKQETVHKKNEAVKKERTSSQNSCKRVNQVPPLSQPTPTTIVLHWPSPNPPVPLQSEESLLPLLLIHHSLPQHGQQRKECGMMCQQPPSRLPPIIQYCRANNIQLTQALSLRRHHISASNPFIGMEQLGLGSYKDIRESARLFEDCVEHYLKKNNIKYWTEKEQKSRHYARVNRSRGRGGGRGRSWRGDRPLPSPPTPDFLLKNPVRLSNQPYTTDFDIDNKPQINWIEAKMFYGASTIPPDTQNHAVGNILRTATKYRSLYGPGAIVFSFGCGELLAKRLWEDCGVLVLDAHPLDLKNMERHQRRWCADDRGMILP